jgi:hypothetical protein
MGHGNGGYGHNASAAQPECWSELAGCGATSYNATRDYIATAWATGERNIRIDAGEVATRKITVYRNGKPHVRTIKERKRTLSEGGSAGGGRGWRRGIRGRKGTFQSQYARHYLYKAGMVGRSGMRMHMNRAVGRAILDIRRKSA